VAVEGPRAAGKTTWCRTAGVEFVAEYARTGTEPDGSDAARQGRYWTDVNMTRWAQALDLEERAQVAICDTDPVKLHYSWCLAPIGAAPGSRFAHELACVR
jgi:nicotinamide riboside kinase